MTDKWEEDLEAERKKALEIANCDATNWNKKIDVIPSDDGEALTDEVREITDSEAVEILNSLDGLEKDMSNEVEMMAKTNSAEIKQLGEKVTNLEARLFDYNGDKGHISRTEAMFKELKADNKEGFQTIHELIETLDKTIQHSLETQGRKLESQEDHISKHCDKLANHDRRIGDIEERHDAEDAEKAETRSMVKKAVIGGAIGGGGVVAAVVAGIKGFIFSGSGGM